MTPEAEAMSAWTMRRRKAPPRHQRTLEEMASFLREWVGADTAHVAPGMRFLREDGMVEYEIVCEGDLYGAVPHARPGW